VELLDSIWINEVYHHHARSLIELTIKEIKAVHTYERFEELLTKKDVFRKILNLVHQMEFNADANMCIIADTIRTKCKHLFVGFLSLFRWLTDQKVGGF
jgi:hypothetical protein